MKNCFLSGSANAIPKQKTLNMLMSTLPLLAAMLASAFAAPVADWTIHAPSSTPGWVRVGKPPHLPPCVLPRAPGNRAPPQIHVKHPPPVS